MTNLKGRLVAAAAALTVWAGVAEAQSVAIVTPYLAQPGTQAYVEGFQAEAKTKGWDVNVIDTAGDVAAAVSRIEDAVNQKVDAIVINVDPAAGRGRSAGSKGRGHSRRRHGRRVFAAAGHQRDQQRLRHGRRRPRPMSSIACTARATWSCSSMTPSRRFRTAT